MSLISELAEKLGVKIGQKFCIRHYRGYLLNDWQTEAILIFKFTEDQGLITINSDNREYQSNSYLGDLILGRYQVVEYMPGCEIPTKDPELKKIYGYWDDIHGELHGYINTDWLGNKLPFCTDDIKKDWYVSLQDELMKTDKQLETILALPIFKEVRDERNK